ncbi:SRPBCC family protein [Labrys wisconsinensis]|uniref:Activator of Hsp90 ATPase homologue 1/2-like C-terminal domain-containing protein n=1 Tax=Labrys wisconsinensis TaxID=425677 RepID=A0ABU0JGR3_9HYPH|nr:SRPBCC domain-containing protein [Labrys wisconsinensis]MDQ0473464.1 hypothetical protein [Labrys wisconsinensis]
MKLAMPPQTILIAAGPDRVWDVITKAELGDEWRNANCISDWQAGSSIAITATIGTKRYRDKGEVLRADKPWLLQHSYWSRISGLADVPENYSMITLTLKAENAHTLLTVEQDMPRSPPRRGNGWETGEDSGLKHWQFYWRMALPVLKRIAEQGSPVDPVMRAQSR